MMKQETFIRKNLMPTRINNAFTIHRVEKQMVNMREQGLMALKDVRKSTEKICASMNGNF
jgi:hypothetical protein